MGLGVWSRAMTAWATLLSVLVASALLACGSPPEARPAEAGSVPSLGRRNPNAVDDCAQVPGKPPPNPVEHAYSGLAAKARCEREVYTIMGGVTHFLGVQCNYCHLVPDYRAMTHRKEIANWMAAELVPSLQKKGGGEAWCNDCHAAEGKGQAKILGDPRSQKWSIEWMTTHLVEDFEAKIALRCAARAVTKATSAARAFKLKSSLPIGCPRIELRIECTGRWGSVRLHADMNECGTLLSGDGAMGDSMSTPHHMSDNRSLTARMLLLLLTGTAAIACSGQDQQATVVGSAGVSFNMAGMPNLGMGGNLNSGGTGGGDGARRARR